jgi:hypothetical protein
MAFNLKRVLAEKSKKEDKKDKTGPASDRKKEKDDESGRQFSEQIKILSGPALLDILQEIVPMLNSLSDGPISMLTPKVVRLPMPPIDRGMLESDDIEGPDSQGPMNLIDRLNAVSGSIGDDDYECPVLKSFKSMGGPAKIIEIIGKKGKGGKSDVEAMLDALKEVRAAHRAKTLRLAFSDLNAGRISEAATKLEDVLRDSGGREKERLAAALDCVRAAESGQDAQRLADTAAFRVRQVFASLIPSDNVKLAYTSIITQNGEGYQLCPKAVSQVGHAVPMELSKCRENCIDSRVARDGSVRCAYADWLRTSADSQRAYMQRMQSMKVDHGINEETLGSLTDGKASSFKEPKNMESLLADAREGEPKSSSIEEQLSEKPKGFNLWRHIGEQNAKRVQDLEPKEKGMRVQDMERNASCGGLDPCTGDSLSQHLEDTHGEEYGDETLEEMLAAEDHEGLSDAELDVLTNRLKAYRKKGD